MTNVHFGGWEADSYFSYLGSTTARTPIPRNYIIVIFHLMHKLLSLF